MGRRGNMRGRPGLLFIAVLAVCLIIFYMSWRSMTGPDFKPGSKETYIAQRQSKHKETDEWRNQIPNVMEREDHRRDPDYFLAGGFNTKDASNKHASEPLFQVTDKHENKNQSHLRKTEVPAVKIPTEKTPPSKKYYREPNKSILQTLSSMDRFVHLDLKGAAPKMSYLKEFIPFVRSLGATGLLVEYEDMFPYTGKLKNVAAANAYSRHDIDEILSLLKSSELKVVPLIQTFGHMEYVLKSDFKKLRESEYTPQVIGVTNNATYSLIAEMVEQILDAHPDATYLHIGCDEVYELGKGASADSGLNKSELFLQHVKQVADIVRNYKGKKITPIIWDDELRQLSPETIEKYQLPQLVEIMVWQYSQNVMERINSTVWNMYSKIFKSVWIASSFKGATGPKQFFTDPEHHIQNHFSWLEVIALYKDNLDFKGVALTGWQRYDHFAALCELLPVAIPSLAVCLTTMQKGGFTEKLHWTASTLLTCSRNLEMSFPAIDRQTRKALVSHDCRFPGSTLYHAMQEFYGHTQRDGRTQQTVDGWLTRYHFDHHFSSPGQMKALSKHLQKQAEGYSHVARPLKDALSAIYSDDTVEEWLEENIYERQSHIRELQKKILELQKPKVWERRPFPPMKITVPEDTEPVQTVADSKQMYTNREKQTNGPKAQDQDPKLKYISKNNFNDNKNNPIADFDSTNSKTPKHYNRGNPIHQSDQFNKINNSIYRERRIRTKPNVGGMQGRNAYPIPENGRDRYQNLPSQDDESKVLKVKHLEKADIEKEQRSPNLPLNKIISLKLKAQEQGESNTIKTQRKQILGPSDSETLPPPRNVDGSDRNLRGENSKRGSKEETDQNAWLVEHQGNGRYKALVAGNNFAKPRYEWKNEGHDNQMDAYEKKMLRNAAL